MTEEKKEAPATEGKPTEEQPPAFSDTLDTLTPEAMRALLITQNQDNAKLKAENAERRTKNKEFQSVADAADLQANGQPTEPEAEAAPSAG